MAIDKCPTCKSKRFQKFDVITGVTAEFNGSSQWSDEKVELELGTKELCTCDDCGTVFEQ